MIPSIQLDTSLPPTLSILSPEGREAAVSAVASRAIGHFTFELPPPPSPVPAPPPPSPRTEADYLKLVQAIESNNLAAFEAHLAEGARIDATNAQGNTPLMRAVELEREEFIPLMVQKYKANINHRNNERETPLTLAVDSNYQQMAMGLVGLGADPRVLDELHPKTRGTRLTRAIEDRPHEQAVFLLELGASPNQPNGEGFTPLIYAIKTGNLATIRALARWGADLNFHTEESDFPLNVAILSGCYRAATLLVEELGAPIPTGENSPLLRAVHEGDLKAIRMLGKWKVNPNTCDALFEALVWDQEEVAKVLVKELGADCDVVDSKGTLLLKHAADYKPTWVPLLIELGADLKLLKEAQLRINLANIWSLKGTTTLVRSKDGKKIKIAVEGERRKWSFEALNRYLPLFLASTEEFTAQQKAEMLECARSALYEGCPETDAACVARVNSGKNLIIFGGLEGHSMSYVISPGTPPRLYINNRGLARFAEGGVIAYTIPNLTEGLIHKLRDTTYPDEAAFHAMIRGLGLRVIKNEIIPQKDQRAENCPWSSAVKGCVAALFEHYGKENDVYKAFTAFARSAGLDIYLKESESPGLDLLTSVQTLLTTKIAAAKKYYTDRLFNLDNLLKNIAELSGRNSPLLGRG